MPSVSNKHRKFVNEPMRDKSVTKLAGIGARYGERLEKKGFDKACDVLRRFLELKKDEGRFVAWLTRLIKDDERRARECYGCLKEWSDLHL